MDYQRVLPGPPADPIRRLFWTLGDPAAHHRSVNYSERQAVFMKALGDYVEILPQSALILSHSAEFYFHAAKKAVADPDHVVDRFIEILATAGKRFRVGDSSFAWQSTGNPQWFAGQDPDDGHPSPPNLEARWHRFAQWTTQGRRDGYKDAALDSAFDPDATMDKIYEDDLDEYATIPLEPDCTFCGEERAFDNCSECDVSDDGAVVETTYCNKDCRMKDLDDHESECRAQMDLYRCTVIVHNIILHLLAKTYYRPVSMVKGNRQGLRILSYPIVGDRWTRAVTPTSVTGGSDGESLPGLTIGPFMNNRDHRNDRLMLSQRLENRRDEITRTLDDPRAFVGGLVIGRFRASAVRTRREKTITRPGSPPAPYQGLTPDERFVVLSNDCDWPQTIAGGLSTMGASRHERQEIRDQIINRNAVYMATRPQRKLFQMDCTAAILYGESKEALTLAMPLIQDFLMPLCDKMEVVTIVPKNARVAVTWCGPQSTPIQGGADEGEGTQGVANPVDTVRNNMFFDHHILRATLKTGQEFAIDLTGGQYGWKPYLCPWDLYEFYRIHHIISVEDLVVRVDDSDPGDATTREGIAHALRSQVMHSVMGAIKDHIPEIKSIARYADRDFKPAVKPFYRLVHETIQQAKDVLKREGRFRLFLDNEFQVQMTTTAAQAARYRHVWLTAEEVRVAAQQYDSMLRAWQHKLGCRLPATRLFAPAPPRSAWRLHELFDWNAHTWCGRCPRGPVRPIGADHQSFQDNLEAFLANDEFYESAGIDLENQIDRFHYLVDPVRLP